MKEIWFYQVDGPWDLKLVDGSTENAASK